MRKSLRRRLVLAAAAIASIGSAATLATGLTSGLFSASATSGGNVFTAGTVTLAAGSPASVTCTISDMVPGDSSAGAPIGAKADTTCTYNVKYTGSATAWLGVDIAVTNGGTPMYDGTATGLQLYLNDASPTTYLTSTAPAGGTIYLQQGGTPASLPAGATADLLVGTTPAAPNTDVSFSLDYALPSGAGNAYQGGSVTVTLTFHAVQSGNNALPADCAAGQQCNTNRHASTFQWS